MYWSCISLTLIVNGSLRPYLHGEGSFDTGLRGAFQNKRGLNHFQPVMVFSLKRLFSTFPLLHFTLYEVLLYLTILHFHHNVNQLFCLFSSELFVYQEVQWLVAGLVHVFDLLRPHELA